MRFPLAPALAILITTVPAAAEARAPEFRWPLAGPVTVTRRFDPPPQPWLPGHRGVDVAGEPGEKVLAAGAGTVGFAGSLAGRGVLSVVHSGGLRTTYEPVAATVAVGTPVAAGDPIGRLDAGHNGCPVAACLHWGARRGETYLDPLLLLGFGHIRLKPLHAAPPRGGLSAVGPAALPRAAARRRRSRRRARRPAADRHRSTG